MRSLLPALILTVSLGMAAAIGYAAQSASLCTVRAVSEIMDRRSADMLFSFGKAALWAALIVVPLRWAEIGAIAEAVVPRLGIAILAGAFVFGVGVALNNACAVSTLTKLAAGDATMLVTLAGFVLAAVASQAWAGSLHPSAGGSAVLAMPSTLGVLLLVLGLLWTVGEAITLWRSRGQELPARMLRRRRLALAALVMGLGNAALFAAQGPWAYTAGIVQSAAYAFGGATVPPALSLLAVVAAVMAGAAVAAARDGRFRLRWEGERPWPHHLAGGLLMGGGASLVPGGNDALLLHAAPLLTAHFFPAYATLLVGVAAGLGLRRRKPAPAVTRG